MPSYLSPARVVVFLAFLSLSALTGASCQPTNNTSGVGGVVGSGPSSGIQVVPGSGVDWSLGQFQPSPNEQTMFDLINTYRQGAGLNMLTWHSGMSRVANTHSNDMANRGFFSIVNPEGTDVYERMVSSNPRIDFDNAFAFCTQYPSGTSPNTVFSALIANTATLNVILNPSVTHFAVGFQNSVANGTFIFTVNARP